MATTTITTDTTTVHDIRIVIPDDVLAKIEKGDMVRLTLGGRGRDTQPKQIPWRDIDRLLDSEAWPKH